MPSAMPSYTVPPSNTMWPGRVFNTAAATMLVVPTAETETPAVWLPDTRQDVSDTVA